MTNDFKELSSLSELDFNDDSNLPVVHDEEEILPTVEHETGTSLENIDADSVDDFNYVRKVYHSLIESGQISLIVALRELKASGHPRAAEVVGGLIKQIADVSGQLLDVNEKVKPKQEKGPESQTNIQNNFYGTSNDFLEEFERLEKEREEKLQEEAEDAEFEDAGKEE